MQRHPQQIAQSIDHLIGGVDVRSHQPGNGVERVEQEMRMELPLQRLELRFHQARFETCLVQGARLRLRGKGRPLPGGGRGDAYLVIRIG